MFNFFNFKTPQERRARNQSETTAEKFIKWEGLEKKDEGLDPLNDWRLDNRTPKGLDLTDEEIAILEEKYFKEIQEFSNEEGDLGDWQPNEPSKFPDMETLLDLNNSYHLEYQVRAAKRERAAIDEELSERQDALASHEDIDNYNLMAELAAKKTSKQTPVTSEKKPEKPQVPFNEQIKNIPLYSAEEFDTMLNAYTYQSLHEKRPDMESTRPTYPDGSPIDDKDINKQAAEYENCKKFNKWSKYRKTDIDLMKNCAKWKRYNDYILRHTDLPTGWNGELLDKNDVKELSNELVNYVKENPEDFIKNMVEQGNWLKENLNFKEQTFKGKKQWSAYKKFPIKLPNNTQSEMVVKFVSTEQPVAVGKSHECIYSVKDGGFTTDSGKVVFIKVINPQKIAQLFPGKAQESGSQDDQNSVTQ